MNLEPIVLTRAERLFDAPISRWRKVRHYGPQIARIGAKATVRWVRLLPRRSWRFIWAHWVISLVVVCVIAFLGFVRWWQYIEESTAQQRAANAKTSTDFMTAWKAAFLGDRQAVCYESYNSDLTYNVTCHIGVKGADPTKSVYCNQVGCTVSNL